MDSRNDGSLHVVRIDPGEKIMETLLKYIREHNIRSGFLTGIGAANPIEIGWYDLDDQVYRTTVIKENCEITGIIGNIAWIDGNPIVHAHIMLGKSDYSVVGGHLMEGTITVTGEFWIHASEIPVGRKPVELRGLKLINFGV
jgi:hypothetical protein